MFCDSWFDDIDNVYYIYCIKQWIYFNMSGVRASSKKFFDGNFFNLYNILKTKIALFNYFKGYCCNNSYNVNLQHYRFFYCTLSYKAFYKDMEVYNSDEC